MYIWDVKKLSALHGAKCGQSALAVYDMVEHSGKVRVADIPNHGVLHRRISNGFVLVAPVGGMAHGHPGQWAYESHENGGLKSRWEIGGPSLTEPEIVHYREKFRKIDAQLKGKLI